MNIQFCFISSPREFNYKIKVGSIVAIGIYGRTGIPKRQILNIALAWLVTVPTSAILSGLIMKILLFAKPI